MAKSKTIVVDLGAVGLGHAMMTIKESDLDLVGMTSFLNPTLSARESCERIARLAEIAETFLSLIGCLRGDKELARLGKESVGADV